MLRSSLGEYWLAVLYPHNIPADITVYKPNNRVSINFALSVRLLEGHSSDVIFDTVSTTRALDPATGRFSGKLSGPDESGSFAESLYGPTDNEIGLAVTGKSKASEGSLDGDSLSAALHR